MTRKSYLMIELVTFFILFVYFIYFFTTLCFCFFLTYASAIFQSSTRLPLRMCTAIITISGEHETLGQILSANLASCNMLGRLVGEMVGNNVNIIMPQPFSDLHNEFLTAYQETGL